VTPTTTVHDTFTLERDYPVAPAAVFRAFSDLETKGRWFAEPGWVAAAPHTLDFRVGGREHESGGPPDGPVHTFDAIYHDIVPDSRIIYSYAMTLGGKPISVSLTTVEIAPHAGGSRLRLTEHGAYFDGADAPPARRHGTGELLDNLGAILAAP
jgi:uncharacterized protein YndB with AHSA1/START domain